MNLDSTVIPFLLQDNYEATTSQPFTNYSQFSVMTSYLREQTLYQFILQGVQEFGYFKTSKLYKIP
jgi:hypothetical protein